MARIRTIKPEFWSNEDLSGLPEATHMLAAALLNYADDEGYFNANPKLILADCSPLREPSVSIPESLQSLQAIGYLMLGTCEDGKRYGVVVGFNEHQRVSHPSPSKIKDKTIAWEDSGKLPEPSAKLPETLRPEQGREQGTGKGKEARARGLSAEQLSEFEGWYALYPHKVGRGAAERAWASARALASIEDLKAGVERYVGTKRPDVPWCNPATWLNAKRWMDAPADPKPAEPTASPLEEALKLSRLAKWSGRLGEFKQTGKWQSTWGSEPWTTNSGCFVPVEMRPDFVAAYRSMTAPPIDPPEQRSIQ